MNLKLDFNKIITTVVGTVLGSVALYAGSTLYQLDKDVALIKYQMEQNNKILQDLYDIKKNK